MFRFPRGLKAAVPVFAIIILLSGPSMAVSSDRASALISDVSGRILAVIADSTLDKEMREQRIRGILDGNIALEAIGRFALGASWDSAHPKQRSAYQAAFSDHLLLTYSRLLGAYQGKTFEITGTKPLDGGDIYVISETKNGQGQISVAAWRVREIEGKALILDVVIDGVSMAVTQKSEITSVAKTEGIDGLIVALNKKIVAD